MFGGSYEHTIDEKGRLSIPAKFREAIATSGNTSLTVTNFRNRNTRCLDAYTSSAWANLQQRIRERPQFDPRIQSFQLYYISQAQECQLDKQGRILLPPSLRDYARLDRDVILTGLGEKFSIFDRAAWSQIFTQSEEEIFEDPTYLPGLGL